ncbi:hypothetical protein GLYMA_10G211100v4 [Glycine max]|nr:hypothetical protein GLYMA_10G211100v4 [Glycine max]KAH1139345.1 hypothetical protein GYH30_028670 [Glycine max]
MAPITTYFLILMSSVFYVFWDARVALEEFTVHDHLGFPMSSLRNVKQCFVVLICWIVMKNRYQQI